MHDIYLGGISDKKWREDFKNKCPSKYSILDPFVENFFGLNEEGKTEQIARDFLMMDDAKILVFYFNVSEKGQATRLKLGDAVGRGKQVLVCVENDTAGREFLTTYFNYRGISVSNSIEELISDATEMLEQLKLST